MLIRVTLITILLLSYSFQSSAQERRSIPAAREFGTALDDQRSKVAQLIENYQRAWQLLDANALARIHTTDVEWINAYARMFRGREALQAFLNDRLFPQFKRALAGQKPIVLNPISTRYLNSSAVVVHLYTDFQLGSEPLRRTHFHLVLTESEGTWEIAHSAIMDALE